MRKITQESINAFLNSQPFKKANMKVKVSKENNYVSLYLHDNEIAKYENGQLWITNAGWQSNTTKERLNGLPGVSIYQKNYIWYLNGEKWNGGWIQVNNAHEKKVMTSF